MMSVEEDTKVVVATSGVDVVGSTPMKRKRGRPRKNLEARVAPPVKKKERDDVCFVCFDRTNPNLVLWRPEGLLQSLSPSVREQGRGFLPFQGKMELQECIERLLLLNNPEERRRRMDEVPEIHANPKMDPEYESSEGEDDDKNKDYHMRSNDAFSQRKGRTLIPLPF